VRACCQQISCFLGIELFLGGLSEFGLVVWSARLGLCERRARVNEGELGGRKVLVCELIEGQVRQKVCCCRRTWMGQCERKDEEKGTDEGNEMHYDFRDIK
jgi:hypothetical protein